MTSPKQPVQVKHTPSDVKRADSTNKHKNNCTAVCGEYGCVGCTCDTEEAVERAEVEYTCKNMVHYFDPKKPTVCYCGKLSRTDSIPPQPQKPQAPSEEKRLLDTNMNLLMDNIAHQNHMPIFTPSKHNDQQREFFDV